LKQTNKIDDYANRIVTIWGVTSLKELIEKYNEIPNESDPSALQILEHLSNVLCNYSTGEKIASFMVSESKVNMLACLQNALMKHPAPSVRRTAAQTCFNLTQHNSTRSMLVEHDILVFFLKRAEDSDYYVRHTIAKTLNYMCEKCTVLEMNIIKDLIRKHINVPMVEWMIKTIGCVLIQCMMLRMFINGQWISYANQDLFADHFVASLIELMQITVDTTTKRMCAEALYYFSRIPAFHKIIAELGSIHLIPQLAFKDLVSKSFAVQTIAHCCESRYVVESLVKSRESTIIRLSINGFMMTQLPPNLNSTHKLDRMKMDILTNLTRILAILSDFGEFREMFQVNREAFPKLFDIIDRTQNYDLLILCIRVIISYINNANKEGSGNANLKLLNEKRLMYLVECIECDDLKMSTMATDTFVAYSQHSKLLQIRSDKTR
jgi:hypothetical protein